MDERLKSIARVVDISGVRTDVSRQEIDHIVAACREYHFICAFAMPCFTPYLKAALADVPDVKVGGVIGFPSGADSTAIKVQTAREHLKTGCDELDMVINVGALKSGMYQTVEDDIRAVVDAAEGKPVKSILEVAYLTDDEICRGAELAVKAGVTYVKTGTGWANKPTTVDTIRLLKSVVGDSALIKAAGGVRTLDTMLAMMDAGCSRFGIGLRSILAIMDEVDARLNIHRNFNVQAAAHDQY